ncbi:hypothetical protein, partial [Anaplasma phagocytophilum]|uniref:hypothetical protein n=1 Tax=Anaplasma phagocytophilum TaxID=948 RepID=UPI000ADE0A5A
IIPYFLLHVQIEVFTGSQIVDDFRYSLCVLRFQHQFKLEVGKGILKREVNDFHNPETSVFRIQNITESKNPILQMRLENNLTCSVFNDGIERITSSQAVLQFQKYC